MITAFFKGKILRQKTVFLGHLKSSKNTCILRKFILIGLFVLKNNRTIGKPKIFREGRKGNCPHMLFFTVGYGRQRKLGGGGGVVIAQLVTAGTGVSGLKELLLLFIVIFPL